MNSIKVLGKELVYLEGVTRVEVIDENGRSYVNWNKSNKTQLMLQDGGKTLKIFISNDRNIFAENERQA